MKNCEGTYGEFMLYDRIWMVFKFFQRDSNRFIPVRTVDFQSVLSVCVCVEVNCTRQPCVECGINGKVTQRLEEWGAMGGGEKSRRGGFEMQE